MRTPLQRTTPSLRLKASKPEVLLGEAVRLISELRQPLDSKQVSQRQYSGESLASSATKSASGSVTWRTWIKRSAASQDSFLISSHAFMHTPFIQEVGGTGSGRTSPPFYFEIVLIIFSSPRKIGVIKPLYNFVIG